MSKEPVNLIDNKFFFSVRIAGFQDNTIDPRAGTLELAYKTNSYEDGVFYTEPEERKKLKICEPYLVLNATNFI